MIQIGTNSIQWVELKRDNPAGLQNIKILSTKRRKRAELINEKLKGKAIEKL